MKKVWMWLLVLLLAAGCAAPEPEIVEVPPSPFDVFCERAGELGFSTQDIKPFEGGTSVLLGRDGIRCLGIVWQYNETAAADTKWEELCTNGGQLVFTSENDAGTVCFYQSEAYDTWSVFGLASDDSVIYGAEMVAEELVPDVSLLFCNLGFPNLE